MTCPFFVVYFVSPLFKHCSDVLAALPMITEIVDWILQVQSFLESVSGAMFAAGR